MNSRNSEFHREFLECVNGYFNIPNYLSDYVQPIVKSTVWDVLTAIWRQTVGYQRWETNLSITYLEKITGLSRPTIIRALDILTEGNLIIVEKNEVGMGKRWGNGKKEDLMKKYGGSSSLIKINREAVKILYWLEKAAVKILYWLEKAAVKNLYWYQLKSFTGMGLKPVKNFYSLKTKTKNNKNRFSISLEEEEKQEVLTREESSKKLRELIDGLGKKKAVKNLNENSKNVNVIDIDNLKESKNEPK